MRGHHRVVVQPMLWRCGRPLGRSMLLCFFRLGLTCARRAVSSLSKARNETDKLHFHRGIEDLCSRCELDFPPSWNLCQPDLKTMHLSQSMYVEMHSPVLGPAVLRCGNDVAMMWRVATSGSCRGLTQIVWPCTRLASDLSRARLK